MIRRKRTDEFERLFAEHARLLFKFLVYRTGDRALSEDLVADTFERVLTTPRGFDRRRASEKTWLYTIALNLVRDHARRTAVADRTLERVAAAAPSAQTGSTELDAVEDRDEVKRALSCLSEEEKESIALRYGADLSVPEIAKLTGEKLTTVEGRVYRALRKLKRELHVTSGR